VDFDRVAEFCG